MLTWLRRAARRSPRASSRTSPRTPLAAFRPLIEQLEERRLLDAAGPPSLAALSALPLAFEPNLGQADPQVRYLARGAGYSVFLTPSQAVVGLVRNAAPTAVAPPGPVGPDTVYTPREPLTTPQAPEIAYLTFQFAGANPDPALAGLDLAPGRVNLLLGDESAWRTDLPTYGRVRYQDLYPGIDAVAYGNGQLLQYDFLVAPGADPSSIALQVGGASSLRLDAEGNLVLTVAGQDVVQRAPVLYQEIPGGGRLSVSGRYLLKGNSTVGFEVGPYDRTRPLVIDPVLSYSTYVGGSGSDQGLDLTVDASGNVYVTGLTTSTNFPLNSQFQGTQAGSNDIFVTKLDPTGATRLYSTYLGGPGDDRGNDIAVDASGNAYVVGQTSSTSGMVSGGYQTTYGSGNYDAFLVKLGPAGNTRLYSSYLGGSGNDQAQGVAVDGSQNAYLTGIVNSTSSGTFPRVAARQSTFGGGTWDAFVAKFNTNTGVAAAASLVYSTFHGGSADDQGYGIAVSSTGEAYVSGYTYSTNFPTAAALQTANAGNADVFVSRFNAAGSALQYSTYLGGSNYDSSLALALDTLGNAYVTGETASWEYPTTGGFRTPFNWERDPFVTKISPTGSQVVYSSVFGGGAYDAGWSIAVDGLGQATIAGQTQSFNFPTLDAVQSGPGNYPSGTLTNDAFAARLNAAGSALVWSTYLGGWGDDYATGVAVDAAGNTYVAGLTASNNFTPGATGVQAATAGGYDAFVVKLTDGGNHAPAITPVGDRAVAPGGTVSLTVAATDPEGPLPVGSTPAYDAPRGTAGIQEYGGTLGMDFEVVAPVKITHLGVFDDNSDGLARNLTAFLYDRTSTASPLVTLTFPAGSGTLIGGHRFLPLPTPITLPAGFRGSIVAQGYGAGERNGNNFIGYFSTPGTTNSGNGRLAFSGRSRYGNANVYPTNLDIMPNNYLAGSFLFEAVADGELAANPAGGTTTTLRAAVQSTAPTLDGAISAGEYPTGTFVSHVGNTNPGRIFGGTVTGDADISYTLHTTASATTLYLAFQVTDDFLDNQAGDPNYYNDSIELYFDADGVSNDWVAYSASNREGFLIRSDILGQKGSTGGISPSEWSVAVTTTATGYTYEFAIPFSVFDTQDGAGVTPLRPGNRVNFNAVFVDNDTLVSGQESFVALWRPGTLTPHADGETAWAVQLELSPPITYSLDAAPSGATIDPKTGAFSWTAPADWSPAPTDALAWWPGDRSAADVAGSFHGTATGGANYAAGQVGQGFRFTGAAGQRVSVPHDPALNLESLTSASFEGWFRSDSPGDAIIVAKHTAGSSNGWFFSTEQGGYIGNHRVGGYGTGLNLNDGQWHHFAVVKDGASYFEYVDGVLTGSDTGPATGTANSETVQLGGLTSGVFVDSLQLNGLVDEVGLYSRALSSAEVRAIWRAGSAGKSDGGTRVTVRATDGSGLSDTETFHVAVTPPPSPPTGGQALRFDGVDDLASVPDSASLNTIETNDALTVEAWVKIDAYQGGWFSVVDKYHAAGDFGWTVQINQSSGIELTTTTGARSSGVVLDLGKWYHVAVTYSRAAAQTRFYLNGALAASFTDSFDIPDTTGPLYLGYNPSGSDEYSRGSLDELRLWNRARTGAEILADMNSVLPGSSSGLVGQWRFEEASGTTILDDTPNANHGTLPTGDQVGQGGAPAPAAPGTSYQFDRGQVFLDLPQINLTANQGNTVAFWMYWDGTGNVLPLGFTAYDLWFAGGSFGFNTGVGDLRGISSAGLANRWAHVVATFTNGNSTLNRLWIDGAEQTLVQQFGTPTTISATTQASISGFRVNAGYNFSGRLDDVAFFNRLVSPSEAVSLWSQGVTTAALSGLIGYYRLDESTPGPVLDASGNANHGTFIRSLRQPARVSSPAPLASAPTAGTVLTVTSTADSGPGSLRQALIDANATPGSWPLTIAFAIPITDPGYNRATGVFTINPVTMLPPIMRAGVVLDGTTQAVNVGDTNPGLMGTGGTVGVDNLALAQVARPEIQIVDTLNLPRGIDVAASNVTVRGLAIQGFGNHYGTFFDSNLSVRNGRTGALIEGNVLGTSAASFTDPFARAFTQTAEPATSALYPLGTSFSGFAPDTNDVLGPFAHRGVLFRGTTTGGSATTLGGAGLVYRYRLTFDTPTRIDSVTIGGTAFNGPNSLVRLLDASGAVVGSVATSGGNVYRTFTLTTGGVVGREFFLEEYDTSSTWRYRDLVLVNGQLPTRTNGSNAWTEGASGTFRNNLVGFAGGSGLYLTSSATGWLIQNNEIRGNSQEHSATDQVAFSGNASTTVRGNLITAGVGPGVDVYFSSGITLENNTISGNGVGLPYASSWETPGIRIVSTDGVNSNTTVRRNVLSGNYGAGVQVAYGSLANTLTENSFFDNGTPTRFGPGYGSGGRTGQIGIDLQSSSDDSTVGTRPYRTPNNLYDADSGGNGLVNAPYLTGATLSGGNLTLTGFAPADARASYVNNPTTGVAGAVPGNTAVRFGNNYPDYLVAKTLLFPTSSLSIEFWMRADGIPNIANGATLFSYAVPNSTNEALLYFSNGTLNFILNSASGINTGVTGLGDGAWHHLAVTWQNSNGDLRVYKDGSLAFSATYLSGGAALSPGGVVVLGHDQDSVGGSFDPNQRFVGDLDEVAIYGSVLSAARVSAHQAAGAAYATQVLTDSPTHYWRLGESSASQTPVNQVARQGAALEFFLSDGDPSGQGEGQQYLVTLTEGSPADTDAGSGTYANAVHGTDTTNRFSFTIPAPAGVTAGSVLTATATLRGNTSEFARNVEVKTANTAPTAAAVTATAITEGDVTTLRGTLTDPNALDNHTVAVNWGDGSSETLSLIRPGDSSIVLSAPYTRGSSTYYFTRYTSHTWTQAQALAEQLGGNLVTINDAAENQFLVDSLLAEFGTVNLSVYIGINDLDEEGTFRWASGQPVTYTNFPSGEPNNWPGSNGQNAGSFYVANGLWDDGRHDALYGTAVIEIDGARQFTARHRYRDNGSWTITVTPADDAGGTGAAATGTAAVADAAPVLTLAAAGRTVADSVTEFALTQGQNNWFYGYYATPGVASSFTQMTDTSAGAWQETATNPPWNILWGDGGHPDANRWTVRRWISEVTGAVTLTGAITRQNQGGNGTLVHILVNGAEVFARTLGGSDQGNVNYLVTVPVVAGQAVDFAIDANGTDATFDATRFTAVVTAPSGDEAGGPAVTGSFSDRGRADSHTVTVDWGDATTPSTQSFGSLAEGTATVPVSRPYTYQGHTYYVLKSTLTWDQAQAQAQLLGGHLVTVNDGSENQWVGDLVRREFTAATSAWIGLSHVGNVPLSWISGQPVTFTYFNSGQPENFFNSQPYVAMSTSDTLRWSDFAATQTFPAAVVELDGARSFSLSHAYADDRATPYALTVTVSQAGGASTSSAASASDRTLSLNPVGYWRLDETSGATIADASGNGNTGTLQRGVVPGGAAAPAVGSGTSYQFERGKVFLTLPQVNTTAGQGNTVAFWMYWDGTNGIMPFGFQQYDLWLVSGLFGFNTAVSDVRGISSAGLANRWAHVVAAFTNGDATLNRMWIDGVEQTLTQRAGTPSAKSATANASISGWRQDVFYQFSGRIDDVAVYNRLLAPAEAVAVYAQGPAAASVPDLIGHWKLDEAAGPTAVDASGTGNHGTFAPFASGQPGAPFSGSGASLQLGGGQVALTVPQLSTTTYQASTVAFWMYWDGTTDQLAFSFSNYGLGFIGGGFGFHTNNSNDLRGINAAGLANRWVHVIATFVNSDVARNRLWIDGVEVALVQRQGTPAARAVTSAATIGGWPTDLRYRFSGRLDDVALFKRALTTEEAQSLADAALPRRSYTVANVAPSTPAVTLSASSVTEGQTVTLTGSFIDPGVRDNHAVILRWGDGTPDETLDLAAGILTFTTTHTFVNQPPGDPGLFGVPPGPGAYSVTVLVRDKDGGEGSATGAIGVTNVPPVVQITGAPVNAYGGRPITLGSSVSDVGLADTLTYAWSVQKNGQPFALPAGTVTDAASFTFTPDDEGAFEVSLAVGDGWDATTALKTIYILGAVPSATIEVPLVLDEGSPLTFTSLVTDPFSVDTLRYLWTVTRGVVEVARTTEQNLTFTPQDNGPYLVMLQVTNELNRSATDTKTVLISNVAPTAQVTGGPAGGTVLVDTPATLTAAVTDPGVNDTFTYSWSVTRDGLPFALPAGTLKTAKTFSFTPNQPGTYAATVLVSDNFPAAALPARAAFVVEAGTLTATVTGAPASSPEGSALTFGSRISNPVPSRPVTYSWSVSRGGASYPLPAGTSTTGSTFTFTPKDNGSYTVTLNANNGLTPASASATVTVTNVVPSATITGQPATALVNRAITLGSTVTDPGTEDTFTYAWSVKRDGLAFALPAGTVTTAASFTFTPTDPGSYVAALTVRDDDGGAASVTGRAITVVPLSVNLTAPASGQEGSSLNVRAAVTGAPAGVSFTYLWSVTRNGTAYALPAGTPVTGTSFTFTPDDNGSYGVTAVASGNDGSTARSTATIAVANTAPFTTSLTATVPGSGGTAVPLPASIPEGTPVTARVTAADAGSADLATLSYRWVVDRQRPTTPAGLWETFLIAGGPILYLVPTDNGNYRVTLTVTDKDGGSVTRLLTTTPFVVTNVAPVLAVRNNSNPPAGTVLLEPSIIDPGTEDTYTYLWAAWSYAEGGSLTPVSLSSSAATARTLSLPFVEGTTYVASLHLADDDGGTDSDKAWVLPGTARDDRLTATYASGRTQVAATVVTWADTHPGFFDATDPATGTAVTPQRTRSYSLATTGLDRVILLGLDGDDVLDASALDGSTSLPGGGFGPTDEGGGTSLPGSDGGTGGLKADMDGGHGHNTNVGGLADNTYTYNPGSDTTIIDLGGFDALDLSRATAGVTFNLSLQNVPQTVSTKPGGELNRLTISGTFEMLIASAFADTIRTSTSGTQLYGGGGGDTLIVDTNATDVSLFGGDGDDLLQAVDAARVSLFGGDGANTLEVTRGLSVALYGGSGIDSLVAIGGSEISLFGGDGSDYVRATGGGDISLFGGNGLNTLVAEGVTRVGLFGGDDTDNLQAVGGLDVTLYGGNGDDILLAEGGTNVSLYGGDGSDVLQALAGLDSLAAGGVSLYGGGGDDILLADEVSNVSLFGGEGADYLSATNSTGISLFGGDGVNTLAVTGGSSIGLFGGDDVDSLTAANATDVTLFGGLGNDSLAVTGGSDLSLFGGGDADRLSADGSSNISLFGDDGTDTLSAVGGLDVSLFGGEGADTLTAQNVSNVSLYGGNGANSLLSTGGTGVGLFGGDDMDLLSATGATGATLFGGTGDDSLTVTGGTDQSLFGGDGADRLTADGVSDATLYGGEGADSLTALNASDVSLFGGDGANSLLATGGTGVGLFGGDDADLLRTTGAVNATLYGGLGDDQATADGGGDISLFGGDGADALTALNVSGVSLYGGNGLNTLSVTGGTAAGLFGGDDADVLTATSTVGATLYGGDGGDQVTATGGGDLSLFGGDGADSLSAQNASDVSLFGGDGGDSLTALNSSDASLYGGNGANSLLATGGSNVGLFGGDDADLLSATGTMGITLYGGGGDDGISATGSTDASLFGGDGSDSLTAVDGAGVSLFGGNGVNVLSATGGTTVGLFGGDDADSLTARGSQQVTLYGGDGDDVVTVEDLTGRSSRQVSLFGGLGNDTITATGGSDMSLFGGDGDDRLQAANGFNVSLFGGNGLDTLTALGGQGLGLYGGDDADVLTATSAVGATLFGGDGDDEVSVTGGSDLSLFGGDGADSLTAASAADASLFGGDGADSLSAVMSNGVTLFGGAGDDQVKAEGGLFVSLFGEDGRDSLVIGPGVGTGGAAVLPENAILFGGADDDSLTVLDGLAISLFGGAGADELTAENGTNVSLFGESGEDVLTAWAGQSLILFGGDDADQLTALGATSATLFGGSGNDSLTAGAAGYTPSDVVLLGGSGDDSLAAATGYGVSLFGGDGSDSLAALDVTQVSLYGGAGDDVLTAGDAGGGGPQTGLLYGEDGDDQLSLTAGSFMILYGGTGRDSLTASGGSSLSLYGAEDDDALSASAGAGVNLFGGTGKDSLAVTGGQDMAAYGGSDNDVLSVSAGVRASLYGGDGRDTVTVTGGTQVAAFGEGGNDTLTVLAGSNHVLYGGSGDDTLVAAGGLNTVLDGEDGNDSYDVAGPAPVRVTFQELKSTAATEEETPLEAYSEGFDSLSFSGLSSVTIVLGVSTQQTVAAGFIVTLKGTFEQVTGTPGNDVITGDAIGNSLVGGAGDDVLTGGDGDDSIDGGAGDDVLAGGAGHDTYFFSGADLGQDTIDEGPENDGDLLDFSAFGAAVTIDLGATGPQQIGGGTTLTLTDEQGVEDVTGSAFNDSLTGNARDNVLAGGPGDDTLTGLGGSDTYVFTGANPGHDRVNEAAGADDDALDFAEFGTGITLDLSSTAPQPVGTGSVTVSDALGFEAALGSPYGDVLIGNARDNELYGGAGADRLDGGPGDDLLMAGLAQTVWLDFDSGAASGKYPYSPEERAAIQTRLETAYAAFDFSFTQVRPTRGRYATLAFNQGPTGGAADDLDFRNLHRTGRATIDVNGLLGGTNQPAATGPNFVALTATVAAHELGHLAGLRHGDSFGPIGTGVFAGLKRAFFPAWTGATAAIETPWHIMASPDSVGTTLADSTADTFFGEREAIKLAFAETGQVVPETAGPHGSAAAVQALGPLPALLVPNTISRPDAQGYGQLLNVGAVAVVGSIDIDPVTGRSQNDWYAFTGKAGDIVSLSILSRGLTRVSNPIDSLLRVYDEQGQMLAFSDDEFETQDAWILDLVLPADGAFHVEVDTFTPDGINDVDTGSYELFIYGVTPDAPPLLPVGVGDTLTSGDGKDKLVGGSGDVTMFANSQAEVVSGSGGGLRVLGLPGSVPEGTALTLTGLAAGRAALASLTFAWEIYRGDACLVTGSGASLPFTPADQGPYEVRLTVTDTASGRSITIRQAFAVTNAAPTLSLAEAVTRGEGSAVRLADLGTFGDAGAEDGPWTVTISWGDGSPEQTTTVASRGALGNLSHTYAGQGQFSVAVSVRDKDSGTGTGGVPVTVENVAPSSLGLALSDTDATIEEGGSVTLSGSFVDPGTDDTHTVRVQWGDGEEDTLNLAAGTLTFSKSHTYRDNPRPGATFPITVTVTDKDGAPVASDRTITVLNKAPTASLSSVLAAEAGVAAVASLGEAFDPSALDVLFGLKYSLALTEAELAATYDAASPDASRAFTFPIGGTYAVFGRVFDRDGDYTQYQGEIRVGSALKAESTLTVSAYQGVAMDPVLLATFRDTSGVRTASAYTARIAWGNGTTTTGTVSVSNGVISVKGGTTYAATGTQRPQVTLTLNGTTDPGMTATATVLVAGDVTARTSAVKSGLTYNRTDGLFYGSVTVTNTSATAIGGGLRFLLSGLSSGVTLAYASVTINGVTTVLTVTNTANGPMITVPRSLLASLGAGQSLKLNLRFRTLSLTTPISYNLKTYSDPSA